MQLGNAVQVRDGPDWSYEKAEAMADRLAANGFYLCKVTSP